MLHKTLPTPECDADNLLEYYFITVLTSCQTYGENHYNQYQYYEENHTTGCIRHQIWYQIFDTRKEITVTDNSGINITQQHASK